MFFQDLSDYDNMNVPDFAKAIQLQMGHSNSTTRLYGKVNGYPSRIGEDDLMLYFFQSQVWHYFINNELTTGIFELLKLSFLFVCLFVCLYSLMFSHFFIERYFIE